MLKLSRFQDLQARSNPTTAEKKELNQHIEEFQTKLTELQEAYGLAIVPQISIIPVPKQSPIIT